jgi:hypothetical protein
MKKVTRKFLLMMTAIIGIFSFSSIAQATCTCDTTGGPWGFAGIQGEVKDSNGNPIPNVRVQVIDPVTSETFYAFTADTGWYTFSEAQNHEPTGGGPNSCQSYNVQIQHYGVSPASRDVYTTPTTYSASCPNPHDIDFTYNPACGSGSPTLSGNVVDWGFFPLANFYIVAYADYPNEPIYKDTDSSGNYSFTSSDGLSSCTHYVLKAYDRHYFRQPLWGWAVLTNSSQEPTSGLNFRVDIDK